MKKHKRIIFLVILSIMGLVNALLLFNKYIDNKLESQLMTSLENLSQQNVVIINHQIEDKFSLLQMFANEVGDKKNYDVVQDHKKVEKLSQIFDFRLVGIALPDGTAYTSHKKVVDVSQRRYFQESMKGKNYVSEPLDDVYDPNVKINVYSVPIYDEYKNIKGVFFTTYKNEDFKKFLRISSFNGKGYSYILDSKGNVISDSPQAQIYGAQNMFKTLEKYNENKEIVNQMKKDFQNGQGGEISYNYKGYKYANYAPLNINDWWCVTIVPKNVLEQRILPISYGVIAICIAIFIVSLGVIAYTVIKQNKYQSHLKKIAYYDKLTEIHNKAYLEEKLTQNINANTEKKSALVIYNIRKFKMINEIYGTGAGDYILKSFANSLKQYKTNELEIVVRGYGDEFAVLYLYNHKEELEKRIQSILAINKHIQYLSYPIDFSFAVGIYEIKNMNCMFERIYNYASIAKNENKERQDLFTYYCDELGNEQITIKQKEDAIKKGIENKEFKAWFQPKFDAKSKKITGMEALARWEKEDGSILLPNYFISLSEKIRLIQDIDELVFIDVCKKIKQWELQGLPILPVSVNLSQAYLNGLSALNHLKKIMDEYGVSSEFIQLEITESYMIDNEESLNLAVTKMHEYGFKVLLDDFGVGYSSLMSIHSLDFDILKIDKSFVDAIGTTSGNAIIQYTIQLGKKLDMKIVVEGVETKEQYEFLKICGCDEIQGYYFAKPQTFYEISKILLLKKENISY